MTRKLIVGENDLATVNPSLSLEWHPDKNGDLLPSMVAANSHKNVYWLGKCGHTWSASIKRRNAQGCNCPYCSNQKVLPGFNDMKTKYPKLITEWDYSKNEKKPSEVVAGSSKKYYWICDRGHSWLSTIQHRNRGDNCPYCGNKKLLTGFNDIATTRPDLAQEWDYEKNEKTPQEYIAGSNERANWKCKLGHTWNAIINSRQRGNGCPYCANQKVWPGFNDLASKDPQLASEWDYGRNKKLPSEVTVCSSLPFYWQCEFGHSWSATITNRHQGRGCPECDKRNKTSFPEQAIFYFVSKSFPEAQNRYKDLFDNGMELDIYIPSLRIGIEYDGPYHNSNESLKRDAQKYHICKANGVRLIRVASRSIAPKIETCDFYIRSDYDYQNYDALDQILCEIQKIVPLNGPLNTEDEIVQIQKRYFSSISQNSLLEKCPDLCKEWNYEKNDGFTPKMFTSGSGEKVWWKCSKGHEWKAVISSRVSGKGCPYCNGHKVYPGFNDLATLRPDLLSEWDYKMNGDHLPSEVMIYSTKKVWWICPKGHDSYLMRVLDKSRGHGCPLCRNEKTGKMFSKSVLQYSPEGTLINTFTSATEAGRAIGKSSSAISKACRGESSTCGGYIFRYEENK